MRRKGSNEDRALAAGTGAVLALTKELEQAKATIERLERWRADASKALFEAGQIAGTMSNEIAALKAARAKDAEAWESVRAANNVVRERAKEAEAENLRLRGTLPPEHVSDMINAVGDPPHCSVLENGTTLWGNNDAMHALAAIRNDLSHYKSSAHRASEQVGVFEEENLRLRAALAVSKDPCRYCQLPAEDMARCKAGFPGCARMDDISGCPEFGAMMELAVRFDFEAHIKRQMEWSARTFGPGSRAKGVVAHIRKELAEIEADPGDLTEWVDVIILAIDGAWRQGHEPSAIVEALRAKHERNEGRTWPDWRTMPEDAPIEHVAEPPADAGADALFLSAEATDAESPQNGSGA